MTRFPTLGNFSGNPVGQVGNLRPIGNRPCTGPPKLLRVAHQSSSNRIHFDIGSNPLKLRPIPNQAIIALTLPESLTGSTQQFISLSRSKSLQRMHKYRDLNMRRNQHMNMVSHDHPGVQHIVPRRIPIKQSVRDQSGDLRTPQINWPTSSHIRKPIHSSESLPGSGRGGKRTIHRKASTQPPRKKNGTPDTRIMRQTANMKLAHENTVASASSILVKIRRPIANRPQVINLPHNRRPVAVLLLPWKIFRAGDDSQPKHRPQPVFCGAGCQPADRLATGPAERKLGLPLPHDPGLNP